MWLVKLIMIDFAVTDGFIVCLFFLIDFSTLIYFQFFKFFKKPDYDIYRSFYTLKNVWRLCHGALNA